MKSPFVGDLPRFSASHSVCSGLKSSLIICLFPRVLIIADLPHLSVFCLPWTIAYLGLLVVSPRLDNVWGNTIHCMDHSRLLDYSFALPYGWRLLLFYPSLSLDYSLSWLCFTCCCCRPMPVLTTSYDVLCPADGSTRLSSCSFRNNRTKTLMIFRFPTLQQIYNHNQNELYCQVCLHIRWIVFVTEALTMQQNDSDRTKHR